MSKIQMLRNEADELSKVLGRIPLREARGGGGGGSEVGISNSVREVFYFGNVAGAPLVDAVWASPTNDPFSLSRFPVALPPIFRTGLIFDVQNQSRVIARNGRSFSQAIIPKYQSGRLVVALSYTGLTHIDPLTGFEAPINWVDTNGADVRLWGDLS